MNMNMNMNICKAPLNEAQWRRTQQCKQQN